MRFASNYELSVARAKAVADLIRAGADAIPTRLADRGQGRRQPIASNTTPEGRAKNRRVEVIDPARRLSAVGAEERMSNENYDPRQ